METRLSSKTKEVIISDKVPTILVGECVNSADKEKISAALRKGDMALICNEAIVQVEAGADIVDVNIGVAGIDELVVLPQAVRAIMDTVDVPPVS